MMRHFVSGGAILALLMLAAPARAVIIYETFEDPSIVPGTPLSDYWDENPGQPTTAVDTSVRSISKASAATTARWSS